MYSLCDIHFTHLESTLRTLCSAANGLGAVLDVCATWISVVPAERAQNRALQAGVTTLLCNSAEEKATSKQNGEAFAPL